MASKLNWNCVRVARKTDRSREIKLKEMDGAGSSSSGKYLVWQDLTVVAGTSSGSRSKLLLNGVTGYAQPDRIMALMGPSGSGKSTFLDALAG